MKKLASVLLILFVNFYRYAISPLTPASCRYTPTCSEYAIEALKKHGPIKGLWLSINPIKSAGISVKARCVEQLVSQGVGHI